MGRAASLARLPRGTLPLRVYFFASFAALGVYTPFFPRWLVARGVEGVAMGAVVATIPAMGIVGPPLVGLFADSLGLRGSVLRTACLGSFFVFALLAVAGLAHHQLGFLEILVMVLVFAAFRAPMLSMADVVAVERERDARDSYGRTRLWGSVGFLVASAGVGRFLDPESPVELPAIIAVSLFVALLTALVIPVESVAAHLPLAEKVRGLVAASDLPAMLVAVFVAELRHLQLRDSASRSTSPTSARRAPSSASPGPLGVSAEIVMMAATAPLIARFGAPPLMVFALGVIALRCALLAVVRSLPAVLVVQLLHSPSVALLWTAALAHLKQRTRAADVRDGPGALLGGDRGGRRRRDAPLGSALPPRRAAAPRSLWRRSWRPPPWRWRCAGRRALAREAQPDFPAGGAGTTHDCDRGRCRVPRLIILSNRLPVTVCPAGGDVSIVPSTGGLTTALRALHERHDGLWIGWAGAAAPPEDGQTGQDDRAAACLAELRAVPVPLDAAEVTRYYEGFSNSTLWPLLHYFLDTARFEDDGAFETYKAVNARFADAAALHYRPGDVIWVHDYHLMLAPEMIRARLPRARVGFFLHTPFPSWEVFRMLPWRERLLHGLLGADLIGFQTGAYRQHFLDAVARLLDLEPEGDTVVYDGRRVRLGAYPIGIDPAPSRSSPSGPTCARRRSASARRRPGGASCSASTGSTTPRGSRSGSPRSSASSTARRSSARCASSRSPCPRARAPAATSRCARRSTRWWAA